MEWQLVSNGYVLRGARYGARMVLGEFPFFRFTLDGTVLADLPAFSCLDRMNQKEQLSDVTLERMQTDGDCLEVVFRAASNLWISHRFIWKFQRYLVEHFHIVQGNGALARCFFFSSGIPGEYDWGDSAGHQTNARIQVEHFFIPKVNLANVNEYHVSQYACTGLGGEMRIPGDIFLPERACGLFSPSPLFFAFYQGSSVLGIGLGTQPGNYRFNAFEYSGARKSGASFHVQYYGYTSADGEFTTPSISLTFGYSPYDTLEQHVKWLDSRGFSTAFRNPVPPSWHRAPIFCGWAEQTTQAENAKAHASAYATQKNYTAWIAEAEERGIPISTIVIDDKWQKYYGTFEIDTDKWPDMKGFVEQQHRKGRHVLLWTASYHAEGLPDELCIFDNKGNKLFADVSNPDYEELIRRQITYLVSEIGIDGFKEDWIGRTVQEPGLPGYGKLHGLEMVRRFQFILSDAAHQVKEDALIETQTPHPLFRESSDVLRLNDLWFATRNVCESMQVRARISRICGWDVLDCDNASCTTPEEWFRYAQFQVRLGTPALYFLHETESFHETVPKEMWDYLASIWKKYEAENLSQP